jgi:hypothetical protein
MEMKASDVSRYFNAAKNHIGVRKSKKPIIKAELKRVLLVIRFDEK